MRTGDSDRRELVSFTLNQDSGIGLGHWELVLECGHTERRSAGEIYPVIGRPYRCTECRKRRMAAETGIERAETT